MIKITLILAMALFGTTVVPIETTNLPSIEFSKPASEFESGQPVFPKGTKAVLKNLSADQSRVMINDQIDKVLVTDQVDVSNLVELTEGTYTVIVESSKGKSEIFGFTIK